LAIVAAVVAAAINYFFGNPFDPFDNKRFSPELWRAADEDSRARMCRDVMRRFIRPGMTEEEIIALLGPPNDVQEGEKRDRFIGDYSFRYWIGSWSFQRMDDAFLYVHFGSGRRVVAREIYGC
jgi:hypothetical protein